MLNNLIFYNNYNTGDLFTARTFILELISRGIADDYFFAHHHDPYLTSDFIKYYRPDEFCMDRKSFHKEGDNLFFNTWIGYAYSKYVLPGVVCRLDNFKKLYNDTLRAAGIDYQLTRKDDEYIPSISQFTVEKENIDNFISSRDKDRKLVLLSNGLVYSGQAINFDLNYIIYKLSMKHTNVDFIATARFDYEANNLFYTSDIIKKSGSDLKEIGYLSLFADVIIGRSSGPYVYCQLKENYQNENKTFLSFTKERGCAHMPMGNVNARLLWSKETNLDVVQRKIEEVL